MSRLKNKVRGFFAIGMMLTLLGNPMTVSASPTILETEELTAFLDDVIQREMEAHHIPNLSVAVVHNGSILTVKGYGFADLATNAAVDPDKSLFRIGSTSKLFAWTAVMQLVEQGKLNLDTDINEYLDFEIPNRLERRWRQEKAGPITLRHLMAHTPGFEDYMTAVFSISEDSLKPLSQQVRENRPARVFLPGEVTAYSNYGVSLAGYVVQMVSGMRFEEYVEKHIFKPLGMGNSTFRQPVPEAMTQQTAKPYRYVNGEYMEADFEFVSGPAGGMSSSADDMARFMLAYLQGGQGVEGQILQEETIDQIFGETTTPHPQLDGMAHGFIKATFNGREVFHHPGGTMLYDTGLYLIPEENIGFFISHSGGSALVNNRIFLQLMDHYFPWEAQNDLKIPEGMADRSAAYGGEYYQNRRSFTNTDAALSLIFGRIQVMTDETGHLLVTNMGETHRFVEMEPGIYRNLQERQAQKHGGDFRTIVFSTDSLGKSMLITSGPMSYSRAAWYESIGPTLAILMGSLLVIIGSLAFWGVQSLTGKFRRSKGLKPVAASGSRWAKRAAVALGLLVFIFLLGVMAAGDIDPVYQLPQEAYTPPSQLSVMMDATIPYAIVALAAVVLCQAVISWKKGYWQTAGRIHFTIFALASGALSWLFIFWNIV
ncbi:serine hydrolase domain-containing protein [Anoxynatronum sibiricum]|uniref:Serine hydrolase domain-containing protein n=1 Tax=Anoxynatronum sibiricum TaxID=210623 RepID=A0ABU9VRS0_9CLOT